MYEKPKVEVVEIHLNECIAGSAVGVHTGTTDRRQYGVGGQSQWNRTWLDE